MRGRWLNWGAAAIGLLVLSVGASAETVTLRVAMADAKTPAKDLEALFAPFAAAHPEIKLQIENSYTDKLDTLAVQVAGGAAADVIQGYNDMPIIAARQGLYLDLAPFVKRDNEQALIDDFVPAALAVVAGQGHIYGFPQYSAVRDVYYNRDMFANAGVATPDPKWNWNDFAAVAKKLTITDGDKVTQIGYGLYNSWLGTFPWLAAAGADFSRPDALPLDSEPVRRTLTFLQDMEKGGYLGWGAGPFLSVSRGTGAMSSSGSWSLVSWAKPNLSLGIASSPIGEARAAGSTNTDIIAINAQTKHPEAAWTFLRWFYSKPVQQAYLARFALQPARVSLGAQWIEAVQKVLQAKGVPPVTGLRAFLDDSVYAQPQPFFANAKVINQYVMPAFNAILGKGAAVGPTLESAAAAGTAFLQQKG
ncbi:MAG TPA: extracellular solute-binding protein [Limnochordia bacterium]|nr:extracellular solute-binding protein [Limnochordia bacterium]